jgi:hypothetical protein
MIFPGVMQLPIPRIEGEINESKTNTVGFSRITVKNALRTRSDIIWVREIHVGESVLLKNGDLQLSPE